MFRTMVLILCSVLFPINLFALSSKKILSEDLTHAAQEDLRSGAAGSALMNEEQWMMAVYQKGKDSYDRGDYKSATAEWDKLSSIADRYPAFKTVMDYLRGRAKSIPPDDAAQVEKKLADRREQIDVAFRKGKEFYDQGKMPEALAEWENLAAYLPEEAPQRKLIADLKAYYQDSLQRPVADSALSKETSAEMLKFFNSASELFKTQAIQSKKALAEAETAQKSVGETYSKSKFLYYQGNYEDAMKEVQKIASFFPEGSQERESAESLVRLYGQAMDEKNAAGTTLTQKNVKAKLPADFQLFSQEVSEKFKAEIKESDTKRSLSEKTAEDKMSWASADFQKGVELYRQGQIDSAIRQWEQVAPSFEDEKVLRDMIENVKKNQSELNRIQTDRDNAVAAKKAELNGRIEKGRVLYEEGNFEGAKKEWLAIKPLVEDGQKIDEFISTIQKIQDDTLRVAKAETDSKAASNARLKTPEEFTVLINSAQTKLSSQIESSRAEQAKSETAIQERQVLIDKAVGSGKTFMDSGNLLQAIQEWSALLPLVSNEAELKKSLEALRSDYDRSLQADSETKIAESKKSTPVAIPEDLSKLLLEAARQISAQIDAASSRKKQAEQSMIDRQAFVNEHFSKGKSLLDNGQNEEALKEWSSLLPYLQDEAKLQPYLEELNQNQKNLAVAQKSASDAESKKDSKLETPAGLTKILDDIRAKMTTEIESSNARRSSADQDVASREKIVQNNFEKGKALYDEGKYSEAIQEWSAMVSQLSESDALNTQFKEIETKYAESIEAGKAAEASDLKKNSKLATPVGLPGLLAEVQQKIAIQAQNYQAREASADKVFSSRQAEIDSIFAKGKLLAEEGKLTEALTQWSSLLPSLEDESKLRTNLTAIQADQTKLVEIQKAAEESEKRQNAKLTAPAELEKTLLEISTRLKGEAEVANGKKSGADKNLQDRTALMATTYEKGKASYEDGRFRDALDEWSNVLPSLDNEAALRPLWEQAAKEYEQLAFAQKEAQDAEARQNQKLKSPNSLVTFLQGMSDQVRIQTLEVKNKKSEADRIQEMKQSEIDKAVMRGNAAFREGNIEQAQKEWLSILPSVDDEATVKTTVEALTKIHEDRQALKKMEQETLGLPQQRFKAPSDISTELADAAQKLNAEKAQAEAKRNEAEGVVAKRVAELQQVFDQGKKLYWEGKISDAIQKWTSIAPLLEDSDVKKGIDAVSLSYEKLLQSQKQAQEAEMKKDNKLKSPEELPKMLQDARQVIQSQTEYAETQKKIADQTFVDRQTLINTTFQKGKNLYEQNQIPEALEEWATITPYLEKGSQIKEFIDSVASNYQNSLVAKKVAEEAQVKKSIKYRTPEDMTSYLNEASEKLQTQVQDSMMQKDAAEKTRRERQTFVDGKFQKGKLLYESGKISEAVDEWKAILPYIEDDSKVRQLILKAEENQKLLQSESAVPAGPTTVVTPPDLGPALVSANEKLETSTKQMRQSKLEEDVRDVIQNKKKQVNKTDTKKPTQPKPKAVLDEIEQMMLEYNVATPAELEKRHQELKAVK